MNIHVEGNTDSGHLPVTAEFAASLDFEPWVRGLEEPMTIPNLQRGAVEHFFTTWLAYETMFKSRFDLVEAFMETDQAEALLELCGDINTSIEWFEMLANMMRGASCWVLGAASYAQVHGLLPEEAA